MTEELVRAKATALPPSAGHSLSNAIPGLRGSESVDRIDPAHAFDPLRRRPVTVGRGLPTPPPATERSVKLSLHSAPEQLGHCHWHY